MLPVRRRGALVAGGALGVACLAGAFIPSIPPSLVLLVVAGLLLIGAVALHPPLAAYVLIGVTPLIAGMDRGAVIPVLRPNEALALLLTAGLIGGGVLRLRAGSLPKLTIGVIDASVLLMALAGSVLPLAWMVVRGQSVTQDDLLYALILWKYYGVYLIVRLSIRTERQVCNCLWLAMIAASIVAVIAVLQSLQLFGVTRILSVYYAPYGSTQALENNRGGATLSLPIAVADLMTFNLAIAVGFLTRRTARRGLLVAAGILFLAGVLASGQISAVIGLLLAALVMAVVTRQVRPLMGFVPALVAAAYVLRPVMERRLEGFQSASGLPVSWSGRLYNLTNYFWPQLSSDFNFLLGVRPAARVATSAMATGYVWIESGYVSLLWSGGIPLLLAFVYFLWASLYTYVPLARFRHDAIGVAALGVVVALAVVGVLMTIDPHLTYRGSADLLFSLLALASLGTGPTPSEQAHLSAAVAGSIHAKE